MEYLAVWGNAIADEMAWRGVPERRFGDLPCETPDRGIRIDLEIASLRLVPLSAAPKRRHRVATRDYY
jgi:hypothetical protein